LKTFDEIKLIAPLQKALAREQYVTPTPIQAQTIPAALRGSDILGSAQTGTGKTAAFALPILNRLGSRNRRAQSYRPLVLVLAPTRELAIQISASFATYGKHLKLRQALVYGGVGQGNQVRSMKRGAHILIATPGRLLDLMNQGHINLEQLEVFVLDEADRMLDMGFLPDLKRIIAALPDQRQSLFFSATLPPNIIELSRRLLTDPVTVHVSPKSNNLETIHQSVVMVRSGDKLPLLRETLGNDDVDQAIVFTRTKRSADAVSRKLADGGIKVAAIHGNKSQNARQRVLGDFRRNKLRVLVATDVAARGIDIDGITHVVNFDLPTEPENYVHRIGRTGRAGASGVAVTFCTPDQRRELRAIERQLGKKLTIVNEHEHPDPGTEPKKRPSQSRRRRPGSGNPARYAPQDPRNKRSRRKGAQRKRRVKQVVS
jgi:ATP-dependent RNA helicase RhlE